MIAVNNRIGFGFLPGSVYDSHSDELKDIKAWSTVLDIGAIVKHIKELQPGYMCGVSRSNDAFTGELFPAAIYDDGPFVFPVDILRYLERGDIHGIPKEYEEYLISEHGLTPLQP